MKRLTSAVTPAVALLFLVSVVTVLGQETPQATLTAGHRIPNGSRIFISEMEGGLNANIASEITKKKLPVVIVTDEKEAEYVISGAALKGDNKWYHTVFGSGKDKNEGNIQVVSVKDRTVIWAGEAGDRSLMWGRLARGGKSKVASRLVGKMKKELFKK
jgi:hypothetical protein